MKIRFSNILINISILFSVVFCINATIKTDKEVVNISILLTFFFIGTTLLLCMMYLIEETVISFLNAISNNTEDNSKDEYTHSRESLGEYYKKVNVVYKEAIKHKTGNTYGQCLYAVLLEMRPDLVNAIIETSKNPNDKKDFEELQPFYTWLDDEWTKK